MNTRTVWIIGIVFVLGVAGMLVLGNDTTPENENGNGTGENGNTETARVDAVLAALPYEMTVEGTGGNTVVFDRGTIGPEPRDAYAQLPYEITSGGETQLVESRIELIPGETPIEFIRRFINEGMAIERNPAASTQLDYAVSLHPLDADVLQQYPAADDPAAEAPEEGLSAYVRASNVPDDSIGGAEHRFDFIVSSGNNWVFVWHGERTHCRRPENEFWQSADQLCP